MWCKVFFHSRGEIIDEKKSFSSEKLLKRKLTKSFKMANVCVCLVSLANIFESERQQAFSKTKQGQKEYCC